MRGDYFETLLNESIEAATRSLVSDYPPPFPPSSVSYNSKERPMGRNTAVDKFLNIMASEYANNFRKPKVAVLTREQRVTLEHEIIDTMIKTPYQGQADVIGDVKLVTAPAGVLVDLRGRDLKPDARYRVVSDYAFGPVSTPFKVVDRDTPEGAYDTVATFATRDAAEKHAKELNADG